MKNTDINGACLNFFTFSLYSSPISVHKKIFPKLVYIFIKYVYFKHSLYVGRQVIISKVPSHLLRLLQAQDANRVVLVSYKQRTTYISMSCFYKILFNHKSNTHPHTHTGSISLWHVALYSLISSHIYKPTLSLSLSLSFSQS